MENSSRLRPLLVVLAVAGSLALPGAARASEPQPGDPGKDVMYLPTSPALVEKMLDAARVTPADFVVDLGSGDGRMVIAAARRGARALGVEYNPQLVALARRRAAEAGVEERASFVQGDMFEADISKATVLALFLVSSNLEKLKPQLRTLAPGTRIVNNGYRIPGWQEDGMVQAISDCTSWCTAYLYVLPARPAQ